MDIYIPVWITYFVTYLAGALTVIVLFLAYAIKKTWDEKID